MHEYRTTLRKGPRNRLSDSHTRVRRRVLEILNDLTTPVAEEELAAELAGRSGGGPVRTLSGRAARIELRHVHLPTLADAGFVTWDENDATVTAAAHPARYDGTFERVDGGENDEGTDGIVDAPNGRRRAVLGILESRYGPQGRDDLAREVAVREAGEEPSTEAVEEVLVTLHHVHLPKLEHAGLVDYDADEGMVSSTDRRERQ